MLPSYLEGARIQPYVVMYHQYTDNRLTFSVLWSRTGKVETVLQLHLRTIRGLGARPSFVLPPCSLTLRSSFRLVVCSHGGSATMPFFCVFRVRCSKRCLPTTVQQYRSPTTSASPFPPSSAPSNLDIFSPGAHRLPAPPACPPATGELAVVVGSNDPLDRCVHHPALLQRCHRPLRSRQHPGERSGVRLG